MSRAVDDIGRMPTISYFSCENGAPRLMASLAKQERLRHVEMSARVYRGVPFFGRTETLVRDPQLSFDGRC